MYEAVSYRNLLGENMFANRWLEGIAHDQINVDP